MSARNFTLVASVCAVAMMPMAGLWHEVIMAQFYTEQTKATHEGTGIIFLAYLLLSVMMVYMFSQWKHHSNSLLTGFKFGALLGLIWVFPHGLAMAGAHGESISYVFYNATWHMIEQGIGGITIAWLYRD